MLDSPFTRVGPYRGAKSTRRQTRRIPRTRQSKRIERTIVALGAVHESDRTISLFISGGMITEIHYAVSGYAKNAEREPTLTLIS